MAAQFGRRLRRGAATTAVAAVAMAALTASQAPGLLGSDRNNKERESSAPSPDNPPIDGDSPYYTDLPPLNTPDKPGTSVDLPQGGPQGPAEAGIPATVLEAYKKAEAALAASDPGCHLPWELLAAIGKVESGQASGGRVDSHGTTLRPILGPPLNGNGFANISDTDGGVYDGDRTHDRAVGPMQFIPSTWNTWGVDGNGDGRKDPNNVFDSALAAGRYLCAGGRNLSVQADLERAILGYNNSRDYLQTVLSWFAYYKKGVHVVADGKGILPAGTGPGSGPGGTNGATASKSGVGTGGSGSGGGSGRSGRQSTRTESGSWAPASGGSGGSGSGGSSGGGSTGGSGGGGSLTGGSTSGGLTDSGSSGGSTSGGSSGGSTSGGTSGGSTSGGSSGGSTSGGSSGGSTSGGSSGGSTSDGSGGASQNPGATDPCPSGSSSPSPSGSSDASPSPSGSGDSCTDSSSQSEAQPSPSSSGAQAGSGAASIV